LKLELRLIDPKQTFEYYKNVRLNKQARTINIGIEMEVDRIDHFVLTVKDIGRTVDFYEKNLGMKKRVFGDSRTALHFGNQKINLHQLDSEFVPKAKNVNPGSADLCFIISTSIDEAISELRENNVNIIEGPVKRTGAKGNIISIYFRDPDGNLIEVSNYMNLKLS
jgi:catechol 2,3-dioxygenase-like lactoylglutathione lyase family enzyme